MSSAYLIGFAFGWVAGIVTAIIVAGRRCQFCVDKDLQIATLEEILEKKKHELDALYAALNSKIRDIELKNGAIAIHMRTIASRDKAIAAHEKALAAISVLSTRHPDATFNRLMRSVDE